MTEWKDLSEYEQIIWLHSWEANGCWAKGSFLRPPYWIFFAASCNIHDYWYNRGVNEEDRKQADKGLIKYMKKDVKRLPPLKHPYYYMWCYLYYFALRMFWKKAFYANKPK